MNRKEQRNRGNFLTQVRHMLCKCAAKCLSSDTDMSSLTRRERAPGCHINSAMSPTRWRPQATAAVRIACQPTPSELLASPVSISFSTTINWSATPCRLLPLRSTGLSVASLLLCTRLQRLRLPSRSLNVRCCTRLHSPAPWTTALSARLRSRRFLPSSLAASRGCTGGGRSQKPAACCKPYVSPA